MKKIKLYLSGEAPAGYVKVQSTGNSMVGNVPKWDFKIQQIFEGILVHKREANGRAGMFNIYEVLHLVSKKGYTLFGGKVLDERLTSLLEKEADGTYKKVKIFVEYVGKPPKKAYDMYEVACDPNFVWDPTEFPGFTGKLLKASAEETAEATGDNPTSEQGAIEQKTSFKRPVPAAINTSVTTNKPPQQYTDAPF